ncbi:MAG: hypothetical protein PHU85_11085 [Phycisphaerae bacterium]|nr:hypothetical protein [Phycisphaerae bacterium]
MPTPTPSAGAVLYGQYCSGCHGPLATSTKQGRTAAQIVSAGMTFGLSLNQIQAVSNALNGLP